MIAAFKQALWLLGVMLSASALISVLQGAFEIGLAPVLADSVAFYRSIADPLLDVLYVPVQFIAEKLHLHFQPPQWFRDAHIMSMIGAASRARATLAIDDETRTSEIGGMNFVLLAIAGLLGFGLVLVLVIIFHMIFPPLKRVTPPPFRVFHSSENKDSFARMQHSHHQERHLSYVSRKHLAISGWAVLSAVVVFYLLNTSIIGLQK